MNPVGPGRLGCLKRTLSRSRQRVASTQREQKTVSSVGKRQKPHARYTPCQSRLATTRQDLLRLLLSRSIGQSFTICAIFNSQEIGTGTSRVVRATGPLGPSRYVLSQTEVYDLQEVAQDAVGPEMIAMANGKNIQVVAETGVCINLLAFLKPHVPLP